MSLTNPAEDQQNWAPTGAVTMQYSDSYKRTRRDTVASIRAALDHIDERQNLPRLAQLLQETNRLADLMVAAARDRGATWEEIAGEMREPVGDVYRRFDRVHSDRPATPLDEHGTVEMYLDAIGYDEDRDRAIRDARNAGATYAQLTAASGLSRAMLDRIINDRTY